MPVYTARVIRRLELKTETTGVAFGYRPQIFNKESVPQMELGNSGEFGMMDKMFSSGLYFQMLSSRFTNILAHA